MESLVREADFRFGKVSAATVVRKPEADGRRMGIILEDTVRHTYPQISVAFWRAVLGKTICRR